MINNQGSITNSSKYPGDLNTGSTSLSSTRPYKYGKSIRADAIPEGSKLEFIGPGTVKFDNVIFKAVRDLKHMSENDLREMMKFGYSAKDISGQKLHGHHHKQEFHRNPGAFIVEIPENLHSLSNKVQHPLGNKGGLSKAERKDWKNLKPKYCKERARTELIRRGLEK